MLLLPQMRSPEHVLSARILDDGGKCNRQILVITHSEERFFASLRMTKLACHSERSEASLACNQFPDLRHSAATILLRMGVNVKVVQEILGHSRISMTLDVYSLVLPGMQEDAAMRMSKLFE